MIRPADIERVRFTTTRLKEGYDQEEVDAFLQRAQDALNAQEQRAAELEAENARLRSRNADLQRRLDAAQHDTPTQPLAVVQPRADVPQQAARLLELAQQTADDLIANAQKDAVYATSAAEVAARETVEAARLEAEEIRQEATTDADARARKAEAAAYRAQQELDAIRELRDNTRAHLVAQLSNLKQQLEDQ